ncbi:MAG TPA: protein kinase, partial [Trebonia sp.]
TDFGIAKANTPDVNLTATGIVMGTALYVSPEQATGQPLSGSSDVYSLGIVAYECLAGDPPFVAEQPLAIAIMHKHDPVPPLPDDVPRPVADLVYAMLAKNPEDRPESARHVADRAEVIREARNRTGYTGPVTSDLPVVPNFPPATSLDIYQNGPGPGPATRGPGNRTFLFAGIGAAAIGVVAIIAVLISSNSNQSAVGGTSTTAPTQTTQAPSHKTASASTSQPVSNSGGVGTGNNVIPTTGPASVSPSTSPSPTAKRKASPTPTPDTSAHGTGTPTPTSGTGTPTPTDSGTGGTSTATPTGGGGGKPTGFPTGATIGI